MGLQPGLSLEALPDDVLLLVTGLVNVKDIVALRLSSKRFGPVTHLRWVWAEALTRHVLDKDLPVALMRNLETLSQEELEKWTRDAIAVRAPERQVRTRASLMQRASRYNRSEDEKEDVEKEGGRLSVPAEGVGRSVTTTPADGVSDDTDTLHFITGAEGLRHHAPGSRFPPPPAPGPVGQSVSAGKRKAKALPAPDIEVIDLTLSDDDDEDRLSEIMRAIIAPFKQASAALALAPTSAPRASQTPVVTTAFACTRETA